MTLLKSKKAFSRLLLIAGAVLFLLSSCASAEEQCYNNFSSFVNSVEKDAPNYSEQDWQACTEAYEAYVQDLDAFAERYTPEQNREIGQLKARYHKLAIKYYLNRASNYVNNMSYQMEGYLDEMGETDNEYSISPEVEQFDNELIDAVGRIADNIGGE